jgi:FKBP-type peptidyl-prolyl cis-trans isomerase FkpA
MRILLAMLATVIMITSCTKTNTEEGYKFTHHIKKGGRKPQAGDIIYFHVDIKAGDKVLNSSRMEMQGEPAKMKMPEIKKEDKKPISPIASGLKIMGIGDSLSIFMPTDTIKQLKEQFPDVKELAYHIVLVDIKTEEEYNKEMEVLRADQMKKQEEGLKAIEGLTVKVKDNIAKFKAGKLATKDLGDGLKFFITEQGTGAKIEKGSNVDVNYYGSLMNGTRFDDSFSRGQSFALKVGEGMVIPGWDQGLQAFNEGSKGYLFIPSKLGYGERGAGEQIPPNSDLVFYVEINKVTK